MKIQEIIAHNQRIQAETAAIKKEYQEKLEALAQPIAPCESCKYDGVYRCETCAENFFEGYNIRNYPENRYENQ